jgi:hypothetical protein
MGGAFLSTLPARPSEELPRCLDLVRRLTDGGLHPPRRAGRVGPRGRQTHLGLGVPRMGAADAQPQRRPGKGPRLRSPGDHPPRNTHQVRELADVGRRDRVARPAP